MKKSGMIMLAAMAALGLSTISTEARSRTETERGSLSSTGVDDNAHGNVKLKVRNSSDGQFDVDTRKLDSRATYDVLADGVLVGRFTTTSKGRGRLRFRSHPRASKDALLGFDPRGALLVVRDDSGHDVLAVELADTGSVGSGDVICCIPDDRGTECEDRTPAECTAQGNTVIAPAHPTIGDEAQFDFDSNGGDIAAGATAIAATFIQGTPPQVTGAILTGGGVVVEATVNCVVK